MVDADVLVVGAGLAGLWAAKLLTGTGRSVIVLEAGTEVGGRVRTDLVDGFTLDRGFQLLNPAYPEGRLAWPGIKLRTFDPGVELVVDGHHHVLADPRRAPTMVRASLAATRELGVAKGLAALAAYTAVATAMPSARTAVRPDISIGAALRGAGVDQRTLDLVVQPFLSGVFADEALETSRRLADPILASMLRATPGVPPDGMGSLPRALAADLDIRLGTQVHSVTATSATTATGTLHADALILATQDPAALLPEVPRPSWRGLTTWYFAADDLPSRHRMLALAPGSGVANVAVVSDIAPEYAPIGRRLVAASAVGFQDTSQALERARSATAGVLGVGPGDLELIRAYAIAHALPVVGSPRRPLLHRGVLIAGDHQVAASIQGALASGRAAADVLGLA